MWFETKNDKWPDDEQPILAEIAYFFQGKPVTEIVACFNDGEDLKTMGGDDIGWTAEVIIRWIPLPTPVTQAAPVSPATAIDVSNLRFYSAMAHDFKWQTDVIHWSVISKTLQEIADRVTEAAPVSPRPELVAELLEALKVTLPWLAHRSECMVLLPASEWEKRESWVAQNCCCGIAKFEALIKKAEDTLTPSNSAKEKV